LNTKKIYYWSPFVDKVATTRSVINSALSLNKFSQGKYESFILNASGEWSNFYFELNEKNIKVINFNKNYFILKNSKFGFIKSRLSYMWIFFSCFFPLLRLLKKEKPDFLIIHLITILPLFLFLLFKFKTKLILRISGYPKLNFFRRSLWKILSTRIHLVTVPTELTKKLLIDNNILDPEKIVLLKDPVISCKEFLLKKKLPTNLNAGVCKDKFILSIGRLTKQKNFIFLINAFSELQKKIVDLKLVIVGDGEEKEKLHSLIKKKNLTNKIILAGYNDNIYHYYKNSLCFVLTSLWEDPGFVLIESGYFNKTVISSDCPSGPKELIGCDGGFLYKNNILSDFIKVFFNYINSPDDILFKKKVVLKKRAKDYSIFSHYKNLIKIL
jgi:glycosyltransferase involved in cell wall biosynthesis